MLLLAAVLAGAGALVLLFERDDAANPGSTAEQRAGQASPLLALEPGPEPGPFESTALRAPITPGPPDLVVQGSGWGHGVGMSQYGARAQALDGWTHEEILAYYYPGTEVVRAPEETEHIRVNLFTNRGDLDRSRLLLRTSSRDGGAPEQPVEVALGEAEPVAVPWPQTWELTVDGASGELVLTDNRGEERRRGAGPARVRYEHTAGNQTLLRLPQLIAVSTSTSRLTGTFAWGELEVTQHGGQLQPVMVLPLERYLRGIAEVPSRWEPAALAAQAVAARTYAVRQMRQPMGATCRCHLGATPHHQVYAGFVKEGVEVGHRWREAVEATAGEVVTYEGELAWTYYSSSHGGRSEHSEDSWAYNAAIPYLRSVDDPWSQDPRLDNPYASWTRRVGNAQLAGLVGGGLAEVRGVRVLERTAGDSPRVLEVRGVDADGEPHRVRWDGGGEGSAATALKLHFRALLPSQQIETIGLEPFRDDRGRSGEYALLAAHRAGLIRGCDEGRGLMCPDAPVTRGELAVALTRASAGEHEDTDALQLQLEHPDPGAAERDAVAAELLEPCAGPCTDDEVTRAAAAGAFQAALELQPRAAPHDDAREHRLEGAIGAAHHAGLLPDCDDGAFCPDDPLTRHDLAVALAQAYDLD